MGRFTIHYHAPCVQFGRYLPTHQRQKDHCRPHHHRLTCEDIRPTGKLPLPTRTLVLLLPRYANTRGAILGRMLVALPGAVLLISLLAGRGDYPPIHDVTTDIKDPPVFTMAMAQRGESANSLEIDPQAISAQQQAYPDVQTIRTSLDIEAAFDRAVAVAGDLGWDIYHQDRNAGVIEAVEATAIMAFKDDIVIRVRSNAQGTKVDLRSVSRVGIGDIGANAKRIRAFQQAFAP